MTTFEEALYNYGSIPEILEAYAASLRAEGGNRNLLHATKLLEYKDIISSKSHSALRKIFDNFYNVLNKEMPNLRFRIAGRRKSLISIEQKIRKNLKDNKSLDLIRDMLGVRIILLNGSEQNCYEVLDSLISCCLKNGFTICQDDNRVSDHDFLRKISPVLGHFHYGITDYIHEPKENGYKSLHVIFRNSSGFCFEVQIRTFEMHCNATHNGANHEDYKIAKYGELKFDRTKIKIPGYFAKDTCIIDLVGLEQATEVLQRNKNF